MGDGFIPGLTALVGRDQALDDLRRKLGGGERLIELLGYGGIGKTRLAQELYRDLLRRKVYQDTAFVSLEKYIRFVKSGASAGPPVDLAQRILGDVAAALTDSHQPAARDFGSLISLLSARLRNRRALLVIDNAEPVADDVALVLEELLDQDDASGLQVLVTSRENLGIGGESIVSVQPLTCPAEDADPADGLTDATTLFLDRATKAAGRPVTETNEWRDLVALVRYSQGSPLILQLLAAQLGLGTTAVALLAKLKERGLLWLGFSPRARGIREHHRRLDITMSGSWDLCGEEERVLWARLSVFSESFNVDAVQEVCSDEKLPRNKVEQLLGLLKERSIVDPDSSGRFTQHAALQEYGLKMLGEDESAFRNRHRDWVAKLAFDGARKWFSPQEKHWLDALAADAPNLDVAIDWCVERREVEQGLAIATNVHRVRMPYHHAKEPLAARWFDVLLPMGGVPPTLTRVGALSSVAFMRTVLGDARGLEHLREIRQIAAMLPEARDFPPALAAEGTYQALVMLDPAGMDMLRAAADGFAAMGPDFGGDEQMARLLLGMSAGLIGPAHLADRTADECLAHAERAGAPWAITWAQWLYMLPMRTKRLDVGGKVISAALALGDRWAPGWAAEVKMWGLDDPERAAVLSGASSAWQEQHHVAISGLPSFGRHRDAKIDWITSQIGRDRHAKLEREGRGLGEDGIIKLMHIPAPAPPVLLDATQYRIVSMVADGWQNRDIAIDLHVSEATVSRRLTDVYKKLGIEGDRRKLAAWFRHHGAASAKR
ncbi:helix-turn-helix transcriptional regulator [Amycolatopsis rubida]|uniref:Predicted ATPase n=1 Tax=Amycolatopsis rubida TaxID=112413 RepID=A0A1I5XCA5_9PSEU|nr:AAA family ATPase [Amycolatopsis rubida]SFQ29612.1 Predicted ATPase [Amycolatopsis rubida]